VKGIDEFLAESKAQGVEAIPGIEFSVDYKGKELHLLALCIDKIYFDEIEKMMEHYLAIREQTNKEMVAALSAAGYVIEYDEILRKSGNGYINRAHIAAELVEKGYSASVREAFATLLCKEGPYFRPRKFPDVFDMIGYVRKIGAVPILAHPFLQFDEKELREFLTEARKRGLFGMETVYTEFSEEQTALAQKIAKEFDLLESGGSDYHGTTKPDVAFGVGFGNLRVPCRLADEIKTRKDVISAHNFCTRQKSELEGDRRCGCFYCLKIYSPKEITNWLPEGSGTALCPYCGIDSVIGESSGYPITDEFLKEMKKFWFKEVYYL
jgi:predicted metal-dependent phosphoesterase TrpH